MHSNIKRGLYYCSRLISSQYGTVFTKSDYDKIQKVYSIWVCTNPSNEYRNTATRYRIVRESIEGKVKFKSKESEEAERKDYDLMTLVLICLGSDDKDLSPNGIVKFLSTVFSEDPDFKAKISILENDYALKVTEEFEEEVDRMCDLSEGIREKGIAKGKAEGQLLQLTHDVEMLISGGIQFDKAVSLLKITPDYADKIRKILNK